MEAWIIYALLAAVGFSSANFAARIIKIDAVTFTAIQLFVSGIILLPFMKIPSSKTTIAWVALTGLIVGIAAVLNVLAIQKSPNPGFVMAFGGLTTVLVYAYSFFFLGIGLTPIKIVGSLLVLLGTALVAI